MHSECTGTHRGTWERQIITDKGHHENPINAWTSTHLPSTVVYDVLLFVMFLILGLFD